MRILVQLPQDMFCGLDIEPSTTIKEIKDLIQKKTKLLSSRFGFLYKYKRLEDDKAISNYNLQNNSIIKCYVKPSTESLLLKSQETIDKTGFIRDQAFEIDQDKETAHTAIKLLIRGNKDNDNKPQKLRSDQFDHLLSIGEEIQPKLIKTIFKELDLQGMQYLDEVKFLTHFKKGIGNY